MNCKWEPFGDKFKCAYCDFMVPRNTINKICSSNKAKKKPPNILHKVSNFGKAAVNHITSGMKHCTSQQKEDRYNKCSQNTCGLFRPRGGGGVCAHDDCGCYIRSSGKFMDKLSWASSKCPEGLWGPIEEADKKDTQNT